jgi:predicted ArsR family transcriptional regulator
MTLHAAAEIRGERDRLMRRLNRSGTFTHAELAGRTGLSGAGVRAAISRAPDDPF